MDALNNMMDNVKNQMDSAQESANNLANCDSLSGDAKELCLKAKNDGIASQVMNSTCQIIETRDI